VSSDEGDPLPWRRAPHKQTDVEAQIGRVVRRLPKPTPPDDLHLAHVRQEILQRQTRAAAYAWRVRIGRFPAWAVAIACVLLGGAASAIAGIAVFKYAPPASGARDVTAGGRAPARRGDRPRRFRLTTEAAAAFQLSLTGEGVEIAMLDGGERAQLSGATLDHPIDLTRDRVWRESTGAVVAVPPPVPAPIAAPEVVAPPRPAPSPVPTARSPAGPMSRAPERRMILAARAPGAAARGTAPPAEAPPAATRPIEPPPAVVPAPATEAQLIAGALAALRSHGDAAGALAQLDEHARRFPDGALGPEADAVRVEALLARGDAARALAALDRMTLQNRQSDEALRLIRGELRSRARRFAEAEADLSYVLSAPSSDDAAARALYGRAACRVGAGDIAGARADFESYLRRFPNGPRRGEIEHLLPRDPR